MRPPLRPRTLFLAQTTNPAALGIALFTMAVSMAYLVAASPWQYGSPRLAALLSGLALQPERLAAGRWDAALGHWFLHADAWHLVATLTLLLGAGAATERLWGTWRFCCIWVAGGLLGAAAAILMGAMPMAGGTAGALAVAGVAVVADRRDRVLAGLGGRAAWSLVGLFALGLLFTLDLAGEGVGGAWRVAPQAVAAPIGLLAAGAAPTWAWWRARRYVRGGMQTLQAEAQVRERVDQLLERIGTAGMGSLTRSERRFLSGSSRFFAPGRAHDVPARTGRPARTDAPVTRPPAD